MSMFTELLAIKRFREGQAELRVARERTSHQQAELARVAAQETLERFKLEAIERERQMYADLCSRVVKLRDIEDVMQGVSSLRQTEQQRQTDVERADEVVENALKALATARESHRLATRMTEKFVELAQIHLDQHLREQEYKEDQEMEEAASVRRDREDWEDHVEVDLE
jgi:type III secretion protein O